ncbi:MAG: metal-sensitive transcriptional regulator [Leptospiraceae bacterium]|nr:metal-sensitive transcriptional regulator [Leptospiraceae bacterium]MCB1314344.1 metal-sensitive transcriptional regulator [Leptospiraceae bacterium]MCB1321172.1 metal-sensitive transcriptional regulator [Leptospiraceae bacterium]
MSSSSGNRELINRLNRVQGQIDAIKRSLAEGGTRDCVRDIQLLKAVNNALKKFGEAYVSTHLTECLRTGSSPEEMESNLREVIHNAFLL